ncbi:UvrD-helicase domain-containing protein [Streptomyces sp. BI20]|uniref:UvrD-helicase domain-containing protein n=1 Tax=Streptomyces sp. BI20 TaxID=3403460 RepID=UPI003C782632
MRTGPEQVDPPSLDAAQQAVVDHTGGPLLVLAGPGTGKTTTLVETLAAKVAAGADPSRILVLTFSRKAAVELRDRTALRLTGGRAPQATTFHAYCYALVRAHQDPELFAEPLRLLSGPEQDVTVRSLLAGHRELPEAHRPIRWPDDLRAALTTRGFADEVRAVIARSRELGLGPEALAAFSARQGRPDWTAAAAFLAEYLDVLDMQGSIDYAELVHRAVLLAERTPAVAAQWDAVYVDEYQDTDAAQVRLLRALTAGGATITAFGDPDQSIYAFRGADINGILGFTDAFPGARVRTLDVSRRSRATLLAATRLLTTRMSVPRLPAAAVRAHRALTATRDGGRVEAHTYPTAGSELDNVADVLRRAHLEDGVPWEDMAVLVRTGGRTLVSVRRALAAAGVPVETDGGDLPLRHEPAVAPLLTALRVTATAALTTPVDTPTPHVPPQRTEATAPTPTGSDPAPEAHVPSPSGLTPEPATPGPTAADTPPDLTPENAPATPATPATAPTQPAPAAEAPAAAPALAAEAPTLASALAAEAPTLAPAPDGAPHGLTRGPDPSGRTSAPEAAPSGPAPAVAPSGLPSATPSAPEAAPTASSGRASGPTPSGPPSPTPSAPEAAPAGPGPGPSDLTPEPEAAPADPAPAYPASEAAPHAAASHAADPHDPAPQAPQESHAAPSWLSVEDALDLLTSPLAGLDAADLRRLGRALRDEERAAGAPAPAPSDVLLARALAEPERLLAHDVGHARAAHRLGLLLRKTRELLAGGGGAEEALWTLWDGTFWRERLLRGVSRGGAAARNADRDLDALCVLFDTAARAEERTGGRGALNFLEQLEAEDIAADPLSGRTAGRRTEAVRLMTAHRSKGLEWSLVVVPGLQEGVWPDLRRRGSLLEADRIGVDGLAEPLTAGAMLAEERRLFYVAATRARDRLVVTAVKGAADDGDQPSRFLTELGVTPKDVTGRPRRPLSVPALVAELRATTVDPAASPALRDAAARRLARLAALTDEDGRPLVPAAHPQRWWGLHEPTRAEKPVRERDRPVVLSGSALDQLANTCSLQWFLGREVKADSPATAAQGFGNVVHVLADEVASGRTPADLDVLMERLDTVWDALAFDAPWKSAQEKENARTALERFLRWHHSDRGGRTTVATEHEFDVTIEAGEYAVRVRGSMDRVEADGAGRAYVVDFKTGKGTLTRAQVERHPQLAVYQLAVREGAVDAAFDGTRPPPGGAELVQLRQGAPQKEGGDEAPKIQAQAPLGEGPEDWAADLLATAAGRVLDERFTPTTGEHCTRCSFRSSCSARAEGRHTID